MAVGSSGLTKISEGYRSAGIVPYTWSGDALLFMMLPKQTQQPPAPPLFSDIGGTKIESDKDDPCVTAARAFLAEFTNFQVPPDPPAVEIISNYIKLKNGDSVGLFFNTSAQHLVCFIEMHQHLMPGAPCMWVPVPEMMKQWQYPGFFNSRLTFPSELNLKWKDWMEEKVQQFRDGKNTPWVPPVPIPQLPPNAASQPASPEKETVAVPAPVQAEPVAIASATQTEIPVQQQARQEQNAALVPSTPTEEIKFEERRSEKSVMCQVPEPEPPKPEHPRRRVDPCSPPRAYSGKATPTSPPKGVQRVLRAGSAYGGTRGGVSLKAPPAVRQLLPSSQPFNLHGMISSYLGSGAPAYMYQPESMRPTQVAGAEPNRPVYPTPFPYPQWPGPQQNPYALYQNFQAPRGIPVPGHSQQFLFQGPFGSPGVPGFPVFHPQFHAY
eukprot:TRINITY_DN3350_c0_g1_i1.p1 TRINITY_DN3350_c0_g1~~TRINITY_DN3350_c0_g1_i1.p1  ORF type:complete len:438 (+),score=48.24 TRINITY_DN3350_c0_g1_i1:43-1356(+)